MKLMLSAVEYLQAQDYAEQLFGFTSMAMFQVTTAPSCAVDGHLFVHISIDIDRPTFYSIYIRKIEQGWGEVKPEEYIYCNKQEFPQLIDELVGKVGKYTEQESEK